MEDTPTIDALRALASSRGFDLVRRDLEYGLKSRMTGLPETNDGRQGLRFSIQEAREFLVRLSADGNPNLPQKLNRYPDE